MCVQGGVILKRRVDRLIAACWLVEQGLVWASPSLTPLTPDDSGWQPGHGMTHPLGRSPHIEERTWQSKAGVGWGIRHISRPLGIFREYFLNATTLVRRDLNF